MIKQGIMIFPFTFLIGTYPGLSVFVQALPIMLLITVGLTCIGLTFAGLLKSFEGFGLIQAFINLLMSHLPKDLIFSGHAILQILRERPLWLLRAPPAAIPAR